jgi:hypothetical protein
LGQRSFTRLALSVLQRIDVSPNARVMMVARITETLFAYVDWMSQQGVEVYEEERERWLEIETACAPYVFEKCPPDVSRSTSIRLSPRFVIRSGGIMSR